MLPDPIFGLFYMYGLMIAVGILAAFLVLFTYSKKLNIPTKLADFVFYDAIAAIVIGFGAAALFQATYNYIENPAAGFRLGSGITFIGGLIGGAIAFLAVYFIFRKRLGIRLSQIVSVIPCCIFVAHGFGRVGCFFAGCCHGKPTDFFLGIKFPGMTQAVHPTQLYEAAFLFAMFAVCSVLLFKLKFKHNLSLYFASYGIFRFLIEYLRGDSRGELVGPISPSQFWSLLMIVISVGVFFIECKFVKLPEKEPEAPKEAEISEKE